jgi:hypothetical protein
MQQNEQLTSEQLKKRTEKLGKLKDISSMICPQDASAPAPASKRGRNNTAAAAAAAAAVAAANKAPGQFGAPPNQGPPFMNGPNGPEGMMHGPPGAGGLVPDQFGNMSTTNDLSSLY